MNVIYFISVNIIYLCFISGRDDASLPDDFFNGDSKDPENSYNYTYGDIRVKNAASRRGGRSSLNNSGPGGDTVTRDILGILF